MKPIKLLIKRNFIFIVLALSVLTLFISGCPKEPEKPTYTELRILEPNFIGNYKGLSNTNFLEMIFNYPPFDGPFIINSLIEYKEISFDNDSNKIWKPLIHWAYPINRSYHFGLCHFGVDMTFGQLEHTGDWARPYTYFTSVYLYLQRYSLNNLNLTFHYTGSNFQLTNATGLGSVLRTEEQAVSGALNRPVGALIHPKSIPNNVSNSINLVVMAEGYDKDQMHHFRNYVQNAFASATNFNFGGNEFFQKKWNENKINVFMYETISPETGIGDNVRSYFNVHPQQPHKTNTMEMRNVVNATASETADSRLLENVDVYIIFVNENNISSYTLPFNTEVRWRKGQPVNYIIIKAPVGHDVNASNFHQFVETNRIGELLGTAMAGLMSEYDVRLTQYSESLRNISDVANPADSKWKKLWAIEDFRASYENDHRLSSFKNSSLGSKQLYSPSENCVMRGHKNGATPIQFCPVCEYHLEGSFRTRMGLIPAQNPFYDGSNIDTYEWRGFSVNDFRLGNYFKVPEDKVNFIAVRNNGIMSRSPDGINWAQINTSTSNWLSAAHGGNTWVAVGNNGSIAYSKDGMTWTQENVGTNNWRGVSYGDGGFVAVGGSGSNTSSTGYTTYSLYGFLWNQPVQSGNKSWNSVIYGNGRWVAVGGTGGGRGTSAGIAYSNDLRNWTPKDVGSDVWTDVTYGKGKYVAVNSNGAMAYSTDGINWDQTAASAYNLLGITFGNGLFVAVGGNGNIEFSENGIDWTKMTVGTTYWNSVTYGNGKFVAVGDSGKIAISNNGINWTQTTVGTFDWAGIASVGN